MRKRVALKVVSNGFRCRKDTEIKASNKWSKISRKAIKQFYNLLIPTSIPLFGKYQSNYKKSKNGEPCGVREV